MKRLLLIADSNNIYTKRTLENVLLPAGYEVVLYPIWGDRGVYADFYREKGVTVYRDSHTLPLVRHVPRLRMWARILLNLRDLARLGPFDAVHNHYLCAKDLALGQGAARRFGCVWACSFWGSDLLRAPLGNLRRMRPYLMRCDGLSVVNPDNIAYLRETLGDAVARKCRAIPVGQSGYDDIARVQKTHDRRACRQALGIDPDAFVVAVCYNASRALRPLEMLQALSALPPQRLKALTLVLQITYGNNDPDYTQSVQAFAASLPCRTVTFTRFMGPDENAMLRLSTDVFLLGITTDSFSGTMQEYLYAGAVVLKGDWLAYPPLDDLGIRLNEFHDFSELPALVCRALDGELAPLAPQKRALLPQHYSWAALREKWLALYEREA